MTKKKNLTRSHKNRILGGVLGGVAEYFGWNVTITRLIYVLITLAAFPGIIFYILAWIISLMIQGSQLLTMVMVAEKISHLMIFN